MRQNKKQYYGSLNVNHTTDNKNFWRVVKPNFSKFFANIGKTLTRIDKDKQFVVETNDVIDPVLKAIKGTLMQV